MNDESKKALARVPKPPATRPADIMRGLEEAFIAFLKSRSEPGADLVPTDRRVFLTLPEAANFTGLPLSFLRRLIADRTLTAFRAGRAWRIPRADLEALPTRLAQRANRIEELPEPEARDFELNKLRRLGILPPPGAPTQ